MNRPSLVREVYFEMRRALADRASSRGILESAAAVVDLFMQLKDNGHGSTDTGAVCQCLSKMKLSLGVTEFSEV